jgi:HSP20 family protein
MALIRRERHAATPEVVDRPSMDWPFRPFEMWRPFDMWRRLIGEEPVDVEEFIEDGQVVVRADLPGVDPDRDIDISIEAGNLRIRAERRHEEKTEGRNYWRSEIRYGSFTRTVPLPAGTKEKDITANYKDGILEVRAPVDEKVTQRSKIPISRK